MGAYEDRVNRQIQSRENAKHWLAALIRTSPEDDSGRSDEEVLTEAAIELTEWGSVEYRNVFVRATPEGFVAMDPWDTAEQLVTEIEGLVRRYRRQHRVLTESLERTRRAA